MTCICAMICTRRRPEMLRQCLASFAAQMAEAGRGDQIVVIENDDAPQVETVVAELSRAYPSVPFRYAHEPELGIPFARNRGVELGLETGADWLAFVDDDEWAELGWLEAMRRATAEFETDALTGPVRYVMPSEPPEWMRPFRPPKRRRGDLLKTAATNNTLVRSDWWRAPPGEGMRFDETLRFTGGSDTDFFYRMSEVGGRIHWVDDALVAEDVPPERLTLKWQMNRSRRIAATAYLRERKLMGPRKAMFRHFRRAVRRFLYGGVNVVLGSALSLVLRKRGLHLRYSGLRTVWSSIGTFQSLFGRQPEPYRAVDGR